MQTSRQGNPFSSGHQITHTAAMIKRKEPSLAELAEIQ